MTKNIALFLDGTWNKPDDPGANDSKKTNVRILYEMSYQNNDQKAYYDSGVGTEWYDDKIGGTTGFGLSQNIKQAYYKLCVLYENGDKIFLFGFSRGAFTARSLAGLVYHCGLIKAHEFSEGDIDDMFNIYKRDDQNAKQRCKENNSCCPIEMIGVWDTVGSLGIPKIFVDEKSTDRYIQFHDTALSPEVKAAYHALAIDEQRRAFTPTLWNEPRKDADQILEQVWFAGVHSDIGGGYPDRHHSNIALKWMLECAKRHGLKIKYDHPYTFQLDLRKDIHDSYSGIYGPKRPRQARVQGNYTPKVHRSVVEKRRLRPDYWPRALVDADNDETLAPYEIVGEST
ncbi:MAG: DUF2235 domain-containing protein [Candidatus Binatia bacterium]